MTCSGPERGRRDPTSSSFPLPASLTVAGRRAFEGAVQAYVTQLSDQLTQQSRLHRRRPDAVHTTQDVQEAKQACEQRWREQDDPLVGRRVAITLLVVAAALGVLAITVTGTAQAALFGLFVAAETAGLLLLRRCRPRHPPSG